MEENISKLLKKFCEIKNMGYVKSTRGGTTGIGKTFEDLIGKEEDTLCAPDFLGIEIKTKRAYSNTYLTLFNCEPSGGECDYEIKRLTDSYGYPDSVVKDANVLMNSIYGDRQNLIGNRYYFKLRVSYEDKKIYIEIRNKNNDLLECKTYWLFDELKDRLENKLAYLAVVKAYYTTRNKEVYYKYTQIEFYKLKNFSTFIRLVENGNIRLTLKAGVHRNGSRYKELHNRGTSFQIQEQDLLFLFDYIKVN